MASTCNIKRESLSNSELPPYAPYQFQHHNLSRPPQHHNGNQYPFPPPARSIDASGSNNHHGSNNHPIPPQPSSIRGRGGQPRSSPRREDQANHLNAHHRNSNDNYDSERYDRYYRNWDSWYEGRDPYSYPHYPPPPPPPPPLEGWPYYGYPSPPPPPSHPFASTSSKEPTIPHSERPPHHSPQRSQAGAPPTRQQPSSPSPGIANTQKPLSNKAGIAHEETRPSRARNSPREERSKKTNAVKDPYDPPRGRSGRVSQPSLPWVNERFSPYWYHRDRHPNGQNQHPNHHVRQNRPSSASQGYRQDKNKNQETQYPPTPRHSLASSSSRRIEKRPEPSVGSDIPMERHRGDRDWQQQGGGNYAGSSPSSYPVPTLRPQQTREGVISNFEAPFLPSQSGENSSRGRGRWMSTHEVYHPRGERQSRGSSWNGRLDGVWEVSDEHRHSDDQGTGNDPSRIPKNNGRSEQIPGVISSIPVLNSPVQDQVPSESTLARSQFDKQQPDYRPNEGSFNLGSSRFSQNQPNPLSDRGHNPPPGGQERAISISSDTPFESSGLQNSQALTQEKTRSRPSSPESSRPSQRRRINSPSRPPFPLHSQESFSDQNNSRRDHPDDSVKPARDEFRRASYPYAYPPPPSHSHNYPPPPHPYYPGYPYYPPPPGYDRPPPPRNHHSRSQPHIWDPQPTRPSPSPLTPGSARAHERPRSAHNFRRESGLSHRDNRPPDPYSGFTAQLAAQSLPLSGETPVVPSERPPPSTTTSPERRSPPLPEHHRYPPWYPHYLPHHPRQPPPPTEDPYFPPQPARRSPPPLSPSRPGPSDRPNPRRARSSSLPPNSSRYEQVSHSIPARPSSAGGDPELRARVKQEPSEDGIFAFGRPPADSEQRERKRPDRARNDSYSRGRYEHNMDPYGYPPPDRYWGQEIEWDSARHSGNYTRDEYQDSRRARADISRLSPGASSNPDHESRIRIPPPPPVPPFPTRDDYPLPPHYDQHHDRRGPREPWRHRDVNPLFSGPPPLPAADEMRYASTPPLPATNGDGQAPPLSNYSRSKSGNIDGRRGMYSGGSREELSREHGRRDPNSTQHPHDDGHRHPEILIDSPNVSPAWDPEHSHHPDGQNGYPGPLDKLREPALDEPIWVCDFDPPPGYPDLYPLVEGGGEFPDYIPPNEPGPPVKHAWIRFRDNDARTFFKLGMVDARRRPLAISPDRPHRVVTLENWRDTLYMSGSEVSRSAQPPEQGLPDRDPETSRRRESQELPDDGAGDVIMDVPSQDGPPALDIPVDEPGREESVAPSSSEDGGQNRQIDCTSDGFIGDANSLNMNWTLRSKAGQSRTKRTRKSQNETLNRAEERLAQVPTEEADTGAKPTVPYALLLRSIILDSPEKRLCLNDIYKALEDRYSYFRNLKSQGWKNTVRHNLSLNKCFKKTTRGIFNPGKGCYWVVDENEEHVTSRSRARRYAEAEAARKTRPTGYYRGAPQYPYGFPPPPSVPSPPPRHESPSGKRMWIPPYGTSRQGAFHLPPPPPPFEAWGSNHSSGPSPAPENPPASYSGGAGMDVSRLPTPTHGPDQDYTFPPVDPVEPVEPAEPALPASSGVKLRTPPPLGGDIPVPQLESPTAPQPSPYIPVGSLSDDAWLPERRQFSPTPNGRSTSPSVTPA